MTTGARKSLTFEQENYLELLSRRNTVPGDKLARANGKAIFVSRIVQSKILILTLIVKFSVLLLIFI